MRAKEPGLEQLNGSASTEPGFDAPLRLVGPIYLRTAMAACWKCHQVTRVHALIATEVVDMTGAGDGPCYVFGIFDPPQHLLNVLRERAPKMRLARWGGAGHMLANHCEQCDALMPNYALHADPDGPFHGKPPVGHFGPVVHLGDLRLQFAEYSL